jgi:hypothetical protein
MLLKVITLEVLTPHNLKLDAVKAAFDADTAKLEAQTAVLDPKFQLLWAFDAA